MDELEKQPKELVMQDVPNIDVTPSLTSGAGFNLLQRIAMAFNSATMVPETFRGKGNIGNTILAVNMAQRMQCDPLMLMQNMYVIKNKPVLSSPFMIALFNMCGKFSNIKYKRVGEEGKDSHGMIAYATELATGEVIESTPVTLKMAKAEGWWSKQGSKWPSMTEHMMKYRAAAFLIRQCAPELTLGLYTKDEMDDIGVDKEDKEVHTGATIAIDNPIEIPMMVETSSDVEVEPAEEIKPIEVIDVTEDTTDKKPVDNGVSEPLF